MVARYAKLGLFKVILFRLRGRTWDEYVNVDMGVAYLIIVSWVYMLVFTCILHRLHKPLDMS